jgi:hypothetical protein
MSNQSTKVQGVVSYPNLFKAKRNNLNGKEEYSVDVLIDKKADLKVVHAAINAAIEKKFGNDPKKHPKNLKSPLKDGDEKGTPEYAGKFYITCKANAAEAKLILCDNTLQPLQHPSDIQGGDFVNVNVNFYAYDANGNRGVSAGLQGVQLVRKTDKPFSGRPSRAEDMFESFADDSYAEQNSEMFA